MKNHALLGIVTLMSLVSLFSVYALWAYYPSRPGQPSCCSYERWSGRCNDDSECCPGKRCSAIGYCEIV